MEKPRWEKRFESYQRAFSRFKAMIALSETRELSELENEGAIQRFEYTWEIAWNLLKDYLDFEGIDIKSRSPLNVIRASLEANYIEKGDIWMSALQDRNEMSHSYDEVAFDGVIKNIKTKYYDLFLALENYFLEELKGSHHE